tara:strand:- start:559 stop:672 length:114 start_codon:yes stop_codon:yes gene_type:complete
MTSLKIVSIAKMENLRQLVTVYAMHVLLEKKMLVQPA